MFPPIEAHTIPELRLSPLGVMLSPSKTRITHDLMFSASPHIHKVTPTPISIKPPPVAFGCVLRDVIWRILYLCRRFGPRVRIV